VTAGQIDLLHLGASRVIACYLVETEDGPALFDCGPATTVPALEDGLAARGLALEDVRHLLLSHVHLDHAGAAGVLVREHPHLTVWVSEVGAPHLVEPGRLEASARRLFGEDFDRLWGELVPVPRANVRVVGERVLGLECFPTPGHAGHHVTYQDAGGTSYNGDSAGVRIVPHRFAFAPTPPPDFDLELYRRSLDEIERRRPERIALGHFGVVDDPAEHLARVRESLTRWAERALDELEEEDFGAAAHAELAGSDGEEAVPRYELAAPAWQSYRGLRRYWGKRAQAAERLPE
jgi:glyoxylase-like metal-dependent hydrolase (beta-lactamase superfamily II)